MTKYDCKFKLKAINFYKNNDVSLKETCKKFNIKSHSNLTYWINSYNFNGVEGLKLKANKKYSVEFKASVVNYYKTHEINPRDLTIRYNINPSQVYSWIKIFDLHGIDGLELSGKVGRPSMKKHKKNDKVVPLTDSERNKYINEIINLKSKLYNTEMENDKKGYISLIMDEASNEIMGLQVSDSPNFNLVRNTLNELYKNNPCLSGAIIHSDQGFHYQLESHRKWIDKQNVLQSMSRKGNCLDNSPVESQIGLMKKEFQEKKNLPR